MVQVLIDFRHLARVRLLDIARSPQDASEVTGKFLVSSRISSASKTYSATIRVPADMSMRDTMSSVWISVLSKDADNIRKFVHQSATLPCPNEPLNIFPLGPDDDVDKIDGSLVTGSLDGVYVREGTISSDQIASLDASKLTGTIHPDRIRWSGLTLDMVGGRLDGSRIEPRSLDARHINSVDASRIHGVLTCAELPPNSVRDEHIDSVSWDQIAGDIPRSLSASINIQDLSGKLLVEQLPDKVPPSRVDLSGGLDLSLFTHGVLPAECLPDNCIHDRHIASVDGSKIVGCVDGSIIRPGTVPGSALTAVDATLLSGDLDVHSVQCAYLGATQVLSETAMVSDRLSCTSLEVEAGICVGGSLSAADGIRCEELQAGGVSIAGDLSCTTIQAENVDTSVLQASALTSAVTHAHEVYVEHALNAETVTAQQLLTDHMQSTSLSAHECSTDLLHAGALESDSVHAAHVLARSMEAGNCTVVGHADIGSLSASSIVAGSDLQAETVVASHVEAERADVRSAYARMLHVEEGAVIDGLCDVLDTASVGQDLTVCGAITTGDLHVESSLHTRSVASSSITVSSDCHLQSAHVKGSATVGEGVACNTLEVESKVACASLVTDILSCSDVETLRLSATDVVCAELQGRNISAHTAQAESFAAAELFVEKHLDATQIQCASLLTQDLNVLEKLDVGGAVACEDLDCRGALVCDEMQVLESVDTGVLEVRDDIVVDGVSLASLMRDVDTLMSEATKTSGVDRPLRFLRKQYYADTQYQDGHDFIEAASPAFPTRAITFDLPFPMQSAGLSVISHSGELVGQGSAPGDFPIKVRITISTESEEEHTLTVPVTVTVVGPPIWVSPSTFSFDQKTVFTYPLDAQGATSFADDLPALEGFGVTNNVLKGQVAEPGVFEVGAVALKQLAHNDHVLRVPRVFTATVRPTPPTVVSQQGTFEMPGVLMSLRAVLEGSDNGVEVTRSEVHPRAPPVEWDTPTDLSPEVGDLNVQLIASGATSYEVVARLTWPLWSSLSADGVLQGRTEVPTAFSLAVRAHGSGGPYRSASLGGHSDRLFRVVVVPKPVNFDKLLEVTPVAFTPGSPVKFTVLPSSAELEAYFMHVDL